MADILNIPGKIHSTAADGRAVETNEVYDNTKEIFQSSINVDFESRIASNTSAIKGLDAQNYITLEATAADTTIAAVFTRTSTTPAVNTIYRIANWQGNAESPNPYYNTSYYSEYSTNSTSTDDLKLLNVVNRGIDNTPTDSSNNLVTSGGTKAALDNIAFSTGEKINVVGIDDEPTAGSENLVKSGGVQKYLPKIVTKVDNPSYTEGAMKISGTIDTSATSYGYTNAILLEKGAILVLNQGNTFYHGYEIACVFKCDSNGTFESVLVSTPYSQQIITKYINTFGEDIYVGISGYKNQLKYSIEKNEFAAGVTDVNLRVSVDSEQNFTSAQKMQGFYNLGLNQFTAQAIESKVDIPDVTSGIVLSDGTINSNTQYSYITEPVELQPSDTIFLNQGSAFYHGQNVALLYERSSNGNFIRSIIVGAGGSAKEQYTNTTGNLMYVGMCAYTQNLKYTIKTFSEAAAKADIVSVNESQSLTDAQKAQALSNLGVSVENSPTKGSSKLVNSNGIFNVTVDKLNMNQVNGLLTDNIQNNAYIIYSTGRKALAASAGIFTLRWYSAQNLRRVVCTLGSDGGIPAAVAFYKGTININNEVIGTYLDDYSVQAQAGTNNYIVDVPDEADWVCISNRGANLANPEITLYYDDWVDKVIFERNIEATSSSINSNVNISLLPIGTQLKLEITEVSGSTSYGFYLAKTNASVNKVDCNIPIIDNIAYIEITEATKYIMFYKASCENNKLNFKLSVLRVFLETNRFQPNYLYARSQSLVLGNLFSGYYNPNDTSSKVSDPSWVCYPLQKNNGYTIQVACSDWSTYYVTFNSVSLNNIRRVNETVLTSSNNTVDLRGVVGWYIAFRRQDRAFITPESVSNVVTITKTTGAIWEAPVSRYEIPEEVNNAINSNSRISNIEGNVAAVKQIAQEGYGLNPFTNAPFYYHYSSNDFIKDSEGRNGIASESIEDVEMAARLGFKFIEANVQPTSDGNFITIHGTDGAFGPECKSVDESIITTASLRTTLINSVTLAWTKQYVRYDSYYTKYQTTIPSLEEFCQACKENNIGIFAGTNNSNAISIIRKYIGNNVILYNPSSNIRNTYNGWVFIWNNTNTTSVDTIIANADIYGAPYMLGVGPTLISSLEGAGNLDTLIERMHEKGYLVGFAGVYQSEEKSRELLRLGMDFSGTGHDVNPFESNYEIFDVDDVNHLPTTTGTIINGVITLASGETVTCGSTDIIGLGKGNLCIRFDGILNINFGSSGNREALVSDGSVMLNISDYFFQRKTQLTIVAEANTTINHLVYKTSRC